ncbi:MAG: ATP-binding protein [Geobacteraceae bacterium]|nr:ATP-binding protein [Geobacteraceae bacterium]
MRLNAKLVIIMLSLLVIAMLTLFIMNQYSQTELVHEIQESSTEVSKAIQVSVEDLTSGIEAEPSRLKEYLKEARTRGINEINIISNEGEIINSSDPAKVGKRREIRKMEKGLKVVRQGKATPLSSQRPYDLVVPVIVGDEQLGYVQINLLLDNIQAIQHANSLRRLIATCMVFMLGILLTIFLAGRYTKPIHRLVDGVKKVSAGDLSVTFPVKGTDEIGELAASFNEMVAKLRERESLEKRLYEAEHLSKVGQLASGIAHEIRNPLNYISLAIDHLKSEVLPACGERQQELATLFDKIKEEVRRVNYMVVNFMNYGRPLKLRLASLSYPELIAKALPLLQGKLAEQRIEVVTELAPDLPPMQADPELLRNCLFNFITNAAQAMPGGGRITLGGRYEPATASFRLTFADQGEGIAAEDTRKIFQPYFTTKEAGIGLGLAITERIIKEHGGEILVESELGRGTVFTVVLPGQKQLEA